MGVGHAVEHEKQGLFNALQQVIEGVAHPLHLYPSDYPLMAAAAVEAVEAPGRHAHQANIGPLRGGDEVLAARVVARFIQENLHYRCRVGPQAGENGMKAENHARFALALHAGTRSILRCSMSTRTSFTVMRSASR